MCVRRKQSSSTFSSETVVTGGSCDKQEFKPELHTRNLLVSKQRSLISVEVKTDIIRKAPYLKIIHDKFFVGGGAAGVTSNDRQMQPVDKPTYPSQPYPPPAQPYPPPAQPYPPPTQPYPPTNPTYPPTNPTYPPPDNCPPAYGGGYPPPANPGGPPPYAAVAGMPPSGPYRAGGASYPPGAPNG